MTSAVDVSFSVSGGQIPLDHAFALYQAVSGVLPWLDDEPRAGMQTIQVGAPTDHGTLIVTHRAKLVFRVPESRVDELHPLSGATLGVAGTPISVGAAKVRKLVPFAHINAHFVSTGAADEATFLKEAMAELEKLGVPPQIICGRPQALVAAGNTIRGFSLMLYGLKPDQSMLLQELGLGLHRKLGCGIFIPHKSIVAVGARDMVF